MVDVLSRWLGRAGGGVDIVVSLYGIDEYINIDIVYLSMFKTHVDHNGVGDI